MATSKRERKPSIFGERMCALRKARGWTVRRLAAEASKHGVAMDHSAIVRLETGVRRGNVHNETARAIATALGTTEAYLRGYTDEPRRFG